MTDLELTHYSIIPLFHYSTIPVNPVRNSSRCDSKPSGALNPAGISNGVNVTIMRKKVLSLSRVLFPPSW